MISGHIIQLCICSILLTPWFKDCDLYYFYFRFVSSSNGCFPLLIREVIRGLYSQTVN